MKGAIVIHMRLKSIDTEVNTLLKVQYRETPGLGRAPGEQQGRCGKVWCWAGEGMTDWPGAGYPLPTLPAAQHPEPYL